MYHTTGGIEVDDQPLFQIQDPDIRPRRRIRGPNKPDSSTQRGLTQVKIKDKRVTKQRRQQQKGKQRSRGQTRLRKDQNQDHASFI